MRDNNELFTLCKAVYKATEWDACDQYFFTKDGQIIGKARPKINEWDKDYEAGYRADVPLYASDYLLGKLPKQLDDGEVLGVGFAEYHKPYNISAYSWIASFENRYATPIMYAYSDTPLKALLKLTLKLHEEGLL